LKIENYLFILYYFISFHFISFSFSSELKTITVGGALQGVGIESSSHLYGTVDDICVSMRVILANGKLIELTPTNQNSDLFYGLGGSYGSLALLVEATIKLIPATPFVRVSYLRCDDLEKFVSETNKRTQKERNTFIDAIRFSSSEIVLITANMENNKEKEAEKSNFWKETSWGEFYYQHVQEISQTLANNKQQNQKEFEERIDTITYLFRYDRGAFWCASV